MIVRIPYHSNGRKRRGTKQPLDEGEGAGLRLNIKKKKKQKTKIMAPGPIAAAAKSRQSCPTLCDPHRRKPTRLLCPWDSPGENTAWQIEGGKLEVVADFLFLGSKITADRDCSHEIRRRWQESCGKPRQCVEKQRHYSANKGP